MFSITKLLKGTAAVGAVAIALCLIADSASAAPKKVIRDGKLTDAEYLDSEVHASSSAKAKPRQVRVVTKHYVVHPNVVPKKSGK